MKPSKTIPDGTTSRQMLNAPKDAVFVWLSDDLTYPMELSRKLGRNDLDVRPKSWLCSRNVRSPTRHIVVDHAASLGIDQLCAWWYAESRRQKDVRARDDRE